MLLHRVDFFFAEVPGVLVGQSDFFTELGGVGLSGDELALMGGEVDAELVDRVEVVDAGLALGG